MSIIQNKPKRKEGLSIQERIERYRVMTGECWETQLDPRHKYPQLKVSGRKILVHRASFEAYIGPIPPETMVLHQCDNPRCHRPEHLFLGDATANMRDMAAKGRHRSGPKQDFDLASAVNLISVMSQKEVAKCLGVSQSTVSVALRAIGASRGKATSFGKGHGRGGGAPRSKF